MSAAAGPRPQAHARRWARRLAMQALYQWDLAVADPAEIEHQFREREDFTGVDDEYFRELLHRVPARVVEVDAALAPGLERPLGGIDPVERALLRVAGYELLYRPDVPYRVVINEAVELAKKFGAEQAYTFVNGVLDRVARDLRAAEWNRDHV